MLDNNQELIHVPIMLVRIRKNDELHLNNSIELYDDNNCIHATLSHSFITTYQHYLKQGTVMCIEKPPLVAIHQINENKFEVFVDKENLVFLVYNTIDGANQPIFKSIMVKQNIRISEEIKIFEQTILFNNSD